MKKIKIYFWKRGFQTDGASLWVVQIGKKKYFTKKVLCMRPIEGLFQSRNPHAYFRVLNPLTVDVKFDPPKKGLKKLGINLITII